GNLGRQEVTPEKLESRPDNYRLHACEVLGRLTGDVKKIHDVPVKTVRGSFEGALDHVESRVEEIQSRTGGEGDMAVMAIYRALEKALDAFVIDGRAGFVRKCDDLLRECREGFDNTTFTPPGYDVMRDALGFLGQGFDINPRYITWSETVA